MLRKLEVLPHPVLSHLKVPRRQLGGREDLKAPAQLVGGDLTGCRSHLAVTPQPN